MRMVNLVKTECWYVLDAKEGAKLVYGHTAKTKEELNDEINHEQWQELFIEEEVKAGDSLYYQRELFMRLERGY